MAHTLFRKFGKIRTMLLAPPREAPAAVSPEEQMKRDALKAFPELARLADKVSPMELYNRAKAMSKLKDMADNPEKTFGKTKAIVNAIGV